MRVDILVAHHGKHELDRCLRVGATYLCARCAGMYPAMALGLWATLSGVGMNDGTAEVAARVGLSAIGVGAWGLDRIRPLRFRGANVVRVLAGAVLGVSLGAMLGRHFLEPFRPDVVGQIVVVTILGAAFVLVDLLARRTVRKGRDTEETSPPGVRAP